MQESNSCGLAIARDERLEDMAAVNAVIRSEMAFWPEFFAESMKTLMQGCGTSPKGDYEDGKPSALADHLQMMFPTFAQFKAIKAANIDTPQATVDMTTRIRNRLIQNAWSQQQCYLQCVPAPEGHCELKDRKGGKPKLDKTPEFWCPPKSNEMCQAVCWQGGVDAGNVPLYGIEELGGMPWNLDARHIFQASYDAYNLNSIVSYKLVADGPLTGWSDNGAIMRSSPPLLSVARSKYTQVQDVRPKGDHKAEPGRWLPCSIGNQWGDQSEAFWAAGQWTQAQQPARLAARCRDNFNLAVGHKKEPGLFYVNQCRLLTSVAYSKDLGKSVKGKEEEWDHQNCADLVKWVDEQTPNLRKGRSPAQVDFEVTRHVCKNPGNSIFRHAKKGLCSTDAAGEGYCETLRKVHSGCKAWWKKNKHNL